MKGLGSLQYELCVAVFLLSLAACAPGDKKEPFDEDSAANVDSHSDSGSIPDPCATDNGGCDDRTSCTNDEGTAMCGECPPGYTGTGLDGCTDIDECAVNNGTCEHTCTNTDASFTCSCDTGFTLSADGFSCDDVDECASNNGGCGDAMYYSCTNHIGAAPTCADIDECATNNGGCNPDECVNYAGGAACACDAITTQDDCTSVDTPWAECTWNGSACVYSPIPCNEITVEAECWASRSTCAWLVIGCFDSTG